MKSFSRMKILSISISLCILSGVVFETDTHDNLQVSSEFSFSDVSWHDNCDAITDWNYAPEWDGWLNWNTSTGTIESTDGAIQTATNEGFNSGPFWYKEFDEVTNILGLQDFSVEIGFHNRYPYYMGGFCVSLLDSEKNVVYYIQIVDIEISFGSVEILTRYQAANGTTSDVITTTGSSAHNDVGIRLYSEGNNLMVTLPNMENHTLLSSVASTIEQNRTIQYIGIQWLKTGGVYLNIRLQDISFSGTLVTPISTEPSMEKLLVQSIEMVLTIGCIFSVWTLILYLFKRKEIINNEFNLMFMGGLLPLWLILVFWGILDEGGYMIDIWANGDFNEIPLILSRLFTTFLFSVIASASIAIGIKRSTHASN